MKELINKLFTNKRRTTNTLLVLITIIITVIILGRVVIRSFASALTAPHICSREDWNTYDYSDDQINSTSSGWWQDVKSAYPYRTPEERQYSWDLVPIQDWYNKSGECATTYSNKGCSVNIGTSFASKSSYNVWLYAFPNEAEMHLKIFSMIPLSSASQIGPVYEYKAYYQGSTTPFTEKGTTFAFTDGIPDANQIYDPILITIPASQGAGAYRVEFKTNFNGSKIKPDPGHPISLGFGQNELFPRLNFGIDPYFFVHNDVQKVWVDLKQRSTNTNYTTTWGYDGNPSPVNIPSSSGTYIPDLFIPDKGGEFNRY